MKINEIKEFETGEHCFGETLTVNGVDYEDISKEDQKEFILEMLEKGINSSHLLKEIFKTCLDYLQAEVVEDDFYTCDQCGNHNSYAKWKV